MQDHQLYKHDSNCTASEAVAASGVVTTIGRIADTGVETNRQTDHNFQRQLVGRGRTDLRLTVP